MNLIYPRWYQKIGGCCCTTNWDDNAYRHFVWLYKMYGIEV